MNPLAHILGEELARNAGRRVFRARFGDQDAVTRILSPRHAEGRVAVAQAGSIRNAVLRGTTPGGVVDVAMRDTLDGYGVRAQRLGDDPRWPRALDAGVLPSGEVYITTTWVAGTPLAQCLDTLSEVERRRALVEVATILAELHARGVAHGDLKATNLVWDPVGGVGIIDLDTLRFVGDAFTHVTTTDQTANWSAPEQQRARQTYLASDIWAWAVLAERAYPDAMPSQLARAVSACAVLVPTERPTASSLVPYLRTGSPLVDAHGRPLEPAPYAPGRLVASVEPEPTQRGGGVEATDRSPLGAPAATERVVPQGSWGGGGPGAPLRNASPRVETDPVGARPVGDLSLVGRLWASLRGLVAVAGAPDLGGTRAARGLPLAAGFGGVLVVVLVALALRPAEVLDGTDNDWDGVVDEGTVAYDDDGDGYAEQAGDCDDASTARSPAVAELCATVGVDDDCDGQADEEGAADGTVYRFDEDGDGYGTERRGRRTPAARTLCRPEGSHTATQAGDCYDRNADVHPRASEYYEVHRGDGSYDYNCDGTEELRERTQMSCRAAGLGELGDAGACTIRQVGWYGITPSCGESGVWGGASSDCHLVLHGFSRPTCEAAPGGRRTQACR